MKVLFWMSTSFQTTSRHLLIAVLEALCEKGHSVTVLKKRVDDEEEDLPSELEGKDLKSISIPVKSSRKSNLIARYITDIKYVRACEKYLKTKYDAVFVQSSNVAGILYRALVRKQPSAIKTFNVQDTFPENASISGVLKSSSIAYRILKKIQSYAYVNSDHIITISEDMRQLLIEKCDVAPEKVEVVYNWSYRDELYGDDDFDREALSKIFHTDYFNVVYAGNIGVMQNVDIIIEAAKLLKEENDIHFYIIGNGVHRDKLKTRAEEYGIKNISFLPMQPAELAPSIYGLADVNIIPLKKDVYKTALPSKTATCMACRKPIIFAIGEDSLFGQKVYNETGCLVIDSDNAVSLVESIMAVKNGQKEIKLDEFFLSHMSKKKNSHRYAYVITEKRTVTKPDRNKFN